MAPNKVNNSWSDLNYIKRKTKKKRTEEKLKKLSRENETKESENKTIDCDDYPTVSIAVPGSILDNAQSAELRTYLAGQVARAACIYKVDEVVIFNDVGEDENKFTANTTDREKSKLKSCHQLGTILQYLECPQYLRKHLFPIQNALKYAGVLNPLDAPHHLRKDDKFPFREGVVLTLPPKPGKGSYVDVGLQKAVIIDKVLEPYFRVTVKLHPNAYETTRRIYGQVVPPAMPKIETGTYWGYSVRIANCLNEVFTKCPYRNGYDLTIGTSDKGSPIDQSNIERFTHCLILFGGLHGLEIALENDTTLNIDDVSLLFDHYINTCPDQASRTIRTEEAILITLAELRKKLQLNDNEI